jgi:hypothetical protein
MKRAKKEVVNCPSRERKAKEELPIEAKETIKPERYSTVESNKRYIVPCETCVYLIPDSVCALPICIRLNGWKGQRHGEQEREREVAEENGGLGKGLSLL